MGVVAGAIVVLAGAIMSGTGSVAGAVLTAASKPVNGAAVRLLIGGAVVGIIGCSLVFTSPRDERRR
jgi:hypothetical protein